VELIFEKRYHFIGNEYILKIKKLNQGKNLEILNMQ